MRADCRACGGRDLAQFLDLGEMALAGGFLRSQADIPAERRFPLQVHICEHCRLVQILEAVDPDILFHDYSFASSTIDGSGETSATGAAEGVTDESAGAGFRTRRVIASDPTPCARRIVPRC